MLFAPTAETQQEQLDWLRLIRSENVGPSTFWLLLDRYGKAKDALKALPGLAHAGGLKRTIKIAAQGEAEREYEAITRFGAQLLCRGDALYPEGLAALDGPPPVLTVKGRADLLALPSVAIVGARNASALGRQIAERLGADLTARDIIVASGLARGIDAAAHRGALMRKPDAPDATTTTTVAVLAGGINHIYPPENEELFGHIAAEGLLMSEMPFGFQPQARHFPRRNRLVSGMSLGVAVVEAALKSGSLITARYALEQGREIFAVPGSPLDPRAKGGNNLIKQGASLIESAEDILECLEPLLTRPASERFAEPPPAQPGLPEQEPDETMLDEARAALRPLMGPVATPPDQLARAADLPASLCLSVLLQWELAGVVIREPGRGYILNYAAAQF